MWLMMSSLKRLSLKVSTLNFCHLQLTSPKNNNCQTFPGSTVFSLLLAFFLKRRTNAKGEQLTFDLRQHAAAEVIHRLTTKTTYQPSVKQHGCHTRQHSSTYTHTHTHTLHQHVERNTHDEINSKINDSDDFGGERRAMI